MCLSVVVCSLELGLVLQSRIRVGVVNSSLENVNRVSVVLCSSLE